MRGNDAREKHKACCSRLENHETRPEYQIGSGHTSLGFCRQTPSLQTGMSTAGPLP